MHTTTAPGSRGAGKPVRIALWIVQVLLALFFCFAGFTKLATPISELSRMMPWTGEYAAAFVRFTGIVDLAGGLGILLPALTRILPRLTVLAALGCVVLQLLAIGFHLMRGEAMMLPLNLVVLPLCAFVLWGRLKLAPITSRSKMSGAPQPST